MASSTNLDIGILVCFDSSLNFSSSSLFKELPNLTLCISISSPQINYIKNVRYKQDLSRNDTLHYLPVYIGIAALYNLNMDMYILKIKGIRQAKKMTQNQLAEKVGISRSYLSELENGKWDIKLDLLIKISKVLGVHPSKLIKYK